MEGRVIRSKEFSELVETRYTLILCLNRRAEDWGIEFTGGFFKKQFRDLLTLPSGAQIATLQGHKECTNNNNNNNSNVLLVIDGTNRLCQ